MGTAQDRLKFNVGGRIFETTKTTLASAGSSSFFSALLADRWDFQQHNSGTDEIFIDRDLECFGILLNLLRTGHLCVPDSIPKDSVCEESEFYGLQGHLRAAVRGNLNGNLLRFSHSVTSHASGKGNMIRASPTGGFCVAHGKVVHTYDDWNIVGYPPICLNKNSRIYDILWCDSRNVMISTSNNIGLFNSVTGELSQWFSGIFQSPGRVLHKALCMNSNNEVFSSASSETTGESAGVAVWDPIKSVLKRAIDWEFRMVTKLQWLSWMNCLFAFVIKANGGYKFSFVDHRTKNATINSVDFDSWKVRVVDMAANETRNKICLIDEHFNVGILDHRVPNWTAFWKSQKLVGQKDNNTPKSIHCHGGQLYACTRSNVHVFSGSDRILTSKFQASGGRGGSICDMSIGGDRLFTLHNDPDVVNVWESPRT
ncbi:BTB/POZ domain-containing protein At2g24240-like [Punica granatum]|uniref:Uncharacterized protein n=2 Tax=Punica granatum TaxID=22663 RepID=A0A2I0KAX3_PUNGR|nr:BTB/POZ domain-containing protein At2g24240-like [Punica granatum]PKI65672.1 hypothetical protein CRG98_013967 [Punica granatum]